MRKILMAMALAGALSLSAADDFTLGADVSGLSTFQALGVDVYDKDGNPADLYALMKDYGLEGVRLRVWVDPRGGLCSPADVLKMAQHAHELGMPLMIDFHYSDFWADPGKQNIPERWKNMSYEQMKGAVAEHTASTLQLLRNAGIPVRWVQVGNETSNGMLWPVGNAHENMAQYAGLMRAGYDAVKAVMPEAIVIVHLDNGWDENLYKWNLDGLREGGAKWDMIGMSLYPYWSMQDGKVKSEDEAIERCISNIKACKQRYGNDVMIVETGVEANAPVQGRAFIAKLLDAAANQTDGICRGVWYWAPEADGVLDGYKLGAFQNRRPTEILDAFREFSQKK